MRSLLALLRPAWLGLFEFHAIRGNVVEGKQSCRPSYLGGRMMSCGAALLRVPAAGASVFGIPSDVRSSTHGRWLSRNDAIVGGWR
jgi:hypothetical protein